MLERAQVERLLKLNGVDVTAADEEIKSVLLSARWGEKDVETALLILKENTQSHETYVDSVHKLFQSEQKLKPETITALLGIDLLVSKESLNFSGKPITRKLSFFQIIQIIFISTLLATLSLTALMWYFEVGFFHITSR